MVEPHETSPASAAAKAPPLLFSTKMVWQKKTNRLGASSCLSESGKSIVDDSAPHGDVDINLESFVGSRLMMGKRPSDGDRQETPNKSRAPRPLSDEEYAACVERIDAACQREVWGTSLQLVDELLAKRCDEKVLEMKAQILMELRRDYEAVQCCEGALRLAPVWWEAHRTHGRALLAFGEPRLAARAFAMAVWRNPADPELRNELEWTFHNTAGAEPPGEGTDFTKFVRKR